MNGLPVVSKLCPFPLSQSHQAALKSTNSSQKKFTNLKLIQLKKIVIKLMIISGVFGDIERDDRRFGRAQRFGPVSGFVRGGLFHPRDGVELPAIQNGRADHPSG